MAVIKQALSAQSVDQIRAKARRRLIGAIILVVAAVATLPWLFDSQPRETMVDIPIEISGGQSVAAIDVPLAVHQGTQESMPDQQSTTQPVDVSVANVGTPAAANGYIDPFVDPAVEPSINVDAPGTFPTDMIGDASAHQEAQGGTDLSLSDGYAVRPPNMPYLTSKVAPHMSITSARATQTISADAARAAALLGERSGSVTSNSTRPVATPARNEQTRRFVIQVGAYADEAKASEVRARLSMAGYATFIQEVQTESGKRIRVRLGPYSGRQAADAVADKIRNMGLSADVLPS